MVSGQDKTTDSLIYHRGDPMSAQRDQKPGDQMSCGCQGTL